MLSRRAFHDSLTNLPNRALLLNRNLSGTMGVGRRRDGHPDRAIGRDRRQPPCGGRHFHGEKPLFFRLKSPVNAIAGLGFLAVPMSMSVAMAWEFFGEKNGDPTRARFEQRILDYRARFPHRTGEALSCLVLRDAVFLPQSMWVPWGPPEAGAGRLLAELLQIAHPEPVADFLPEFTPLEADERQQVETTIVQREGQAAFRLRLLRSYEGRCAVTGEHAVPVLEAAHITPYLGARSNHIQNGLVLRSDLHRLYDTGYVTVTPDLRLEVSGRLREEFENGKAYYEMAGRRLTIPKSPSDQPSKAALTWHAEHVFR